MLQNLPDTALLFLLSLFNQVCVENTISDVWKTAIIIPLPRAWKEPSLACSYRPISLTSFVYKLLERMINHRILWALEKRDLLANIQCGFRTYCSSSDHMVSLSSQITNSFVLREHLVVISSISRKLMILPGGMEFFALYSETSINHSRICCFPGFLLNFYNPICITAIL